MPPLRLVRTANMARLTAEFAIWTTITTKCFRVGSGAARRRGEHGETDILCDNGHGGGKWFVAIDAEGGEDYGPHVDRLAAYEETGLEPGEIEQLKGEVFGLRLDKQELEQYRALGPIDRLRELDQAHKENRVLPEGSGWFVTCSGKKLTVVMDIEAALRREQDG